MVFRYVRTVFLLFVLFICSSLGFCADGLITLGDDQVRMVFTQSGALVGIYDDVTGTTVARQVDGLPAWTAGTIKASDGGGFDSSMYPAPKVTLAKDKVQFEWKTEGKAGITGVVTFNKVDRSFHTKILVNNTNPFAIGGITWPAAVGFLPKKSDYAIFCMDSGFESPIKPLDTIKDDLMVYPGHLLMQMAGFKVGESSLLIHTNDTSVYPKAMRVGHDKGMVSFNFQNLLRIRANEKRDIPYEMVYRVFPRGDYNSIAVGYGEWARKQRWMEPTFAQKLKERPMLRRYMEDGFIRIHSVEDLFERVKDGVRKSIYSQPPTTTDDGKLEYTGPVDYNHAKNVIKMMTEYRDEMGIQPGLWDPIWHGKLFDSTYPDYLPIPSYMGDFQWFREQITENKWPVMYHMNLVHWSKDAPSYKREWMIKFGDYYLDNMTGWTWFNLAGGWTSPGLTYPTDRKTIQFLADKAGYNGLYMDEIGHAFAEDENPDSPYTKTDAGYQRAVWDIFKDARQLIKGPIMTEGGNELWLSYCDLFYGTVGGPESDYVPIFDMVYGDRVLRLTGFDKQAFDRTFQNHTWMVGGAIGTQGKNPDLYELVNKQRVVSNMMGTLLLRFDRIGDTRVSNWKSGVVIWNKPSASTPADAEFNTTLGKVIIKGAKSDSCVILARNGEFSADGVGSVTLNGKLIYSSSDSTLSCSYAKGRYVLRNVQDSPKQAEAYVRCSGKTMPAAQGTTAEKHLTAAITVMPEKGGCRLSGLIPGKDALVIGSGVK